MIDVSCFHELSQVARLEAEVAALLAQLNGPRVERLGPRELADLLPFGEKTQPGA